MSKWGDILYQKEQLKKRESDLLDLTMDERDASESRDIHILEKARVAVSESLVQIDLFIETRTASKWRKE